MSAIKKIFGEESGSSDIDEVNTNTLMPYVHKTMDAISLQLFITKLDESILKEFYRCPSVCTVIYRSLPSMARHFVVRMINLKEPVPEADTLKWYSRKIKEKVATSIVCLSELRIWHSKMLENNVLAWELTTTFKENITKSTSRQDYPWSMIEVKPEEVSPMPMIQEIEKYGTERWDAILDYIVTISANEKIERANVLGEEVVRLLLEGGFMRNQRQDGISVTRKSFQFLLLETRTQILNFLFHYIDSYTHKGGNMFLQMSVLAQLSLSTLGNAFLVVNKTTSMLKFLKHLHEFGLIYLSPNLEGHYFPTSLVIDILSENFTGSYSKFSDADINLGEGFMFVTPEMRIFANISSKLHKKTISLFSEQFEQRPGCFISKLTYNSVRNANSAGITASQINFYLARHAHTDWQDDNGQGIASISLDVINKVKEWEQQSRRFYYADGILLQGFSSLKDYKDTRNHAHSTDTLLWENEKSQLLIVDDKRNKHFWHSFIDLKNLQVT